MPTSASFDYAILRVVPRVERQEFVNVGVIVLCRERRYLEAAFILTSTACLPFGLSSIWTRFANTPRPSFASARAMSPPDPSPAPRRASGFHWLTSPRSTILQTSPVHTGICTKVDGILDRLFQQLVPIPATRP